MEHRVLGPELAGATILRARLRNAWRHTILNHPTLACIHATPGVVFGLFFFLTSVQRAVIVFRCFSSIKSEFGDSGEGVLPSFCFNVQY